MKVLSKAAILLIYCTLSVLAKGGGGGGKGGGGASSGSSGSGGSTGSTGSSGSSGSRGSTGSTGSSGSSGSSGSIPATAGKGGSGSFRSSSPPPYSYSNTRTTYTNYPAAYRGGYSPASRYGYYGYYNPALAYWFLLPPFAFIGYNSYYHRYNSNSGYYYAPDITYQGSNTADVVINGTAYSGDSEHNYHYTFNISTNNQFAMADHAFYTSSDHNANPADFAYRVAFTHVVEYVDANQNGFYDSNEQIVALSPLQNLQWQPLIVSNLTAANNQSQYYLETKTYANATYNSSNGTSFGINLTWRVSNLQLNNSAPVIIQPNSLQYDFSVVNYPFSNTNNSRLAVAQLFSYASDETINFDVNMTTPAAEANTIKTNQTYGISIGNYTQGRLEYQNTSIISDVSSGNTANLDPNALAAIPYSGTGDWIWGDNVASKRQNKLLFVTIPTTSASGTNTTTTGSTPVNNGISGFGFLDADVMEALSSAGNHLVAGVFPVLVASFVAFYLS